MGNNKGFTLMEMVLVLAILAILSSIALPGYVNMQKMKNDFRVKDYEMELNVKLREIYIQNGKIQFDNDTTFVSLDTTGLPTTHWLYIIQRDHGVIIQDDYEFKYSKTGTFGTIEIQAK